MLGAMREMYKPLHPPSRANVQNFALAILCTLGYRAAVDSKTIGNNVKRLRLLRDWTRADLAEASGLHVKTIGNVERGQHLGLVSFRGIKAALDAADDDLLARVRVRRRKGKGRK